MNDVFELFIIITFLVVIFYFIYMYIYLIIDIIKDEFLTNKFMTKAERIFIEVVAWLSVIGIIASVLFLIFN